MLVARFRAAEQALVVALAESLGTGDEHAAPIVRTLIELTVETRARGEAATQGQSVYWNQPVCERCWRVLHPDRVAVRAAAEIRHETCAYCGFQTRAGIYTREHPRRVPYPKAQPLDEEERQAAGEATGPPGASSSGAGL